MNGREGLSNNLGVQLDILSTGEHVETVKIQDKEWPGLDGWPSEELRNDDGPLIQGSPANVDPPSSAQVECADDLSHRCRDALGPHIQLPKELRTDPLAPVANIADRFRDQRNRSDN